MDRSHEPRTGIQGSEPAPRPRSGGMARAVRSRYGERCSNLGDKIEHPPRPPAGPAGDGPEGTVTAAFGWNPERRAREWASDY
jgi:hypothetical protein